MIMLPVFLNQPKQTLHKKINHSTTKFSVEYQSSFNRKQTNKQAVANYNVYAGKIPWFAVANNNTHLVSRLQVHISYSLCHPPVVYSNFVDLFC